MMSDMRTVTKRDLSRRTADVLAIARHDGAVTVTERGRAKWTIVAGPVAADPLAAWVAQGLAEPAEAPINWDDQAWQGQAYTSADIDQIVDDLKGDH
jgi:antitoxin (DNA-binding transcriptional repressor) of toxin-antitoxin stability system